MEPLQTIQSVIAEAYKRQSDEAENGHVVKIKSEPDGGLYFAMNKGCSRRQVIMLSF